ncbi:hypothetical protein PInf_003795 [Phytophthora infestans]|nr:hypothetical protein PInf_003795 [Phytophthora infestans]
MEQVKSHVRLLTREAAGEREKKQFLERYAAQVVKERNDLLHSRGSSKKKAASGASHFVWHNCCKKNTSHAMDLAPSILTFRGEKLQEATKQIEALQEEARNQELLRKELDFLLKKTQREHDSKVAADRKHIQQLEKQILQRSALYSSLERKLYEVESVLAQHDRTKEEELSVVSNPLLEQVNDFSADRDRLTEMLQETTQSKDLFAEHIDELTEKCQSLESEVEALRSEIDMLQSKDMNDIRSQYAARIDRLQKENAAREQRLRQEVDRLEPERQEDEAANEPFDWETFIDSASDMSPMPNERTAPKPMDFSTSTIHNENSVARICRSRKVEVSLNWNLVETRKKEPEKDDTLMNSLNGEIEDTSVGHERHDAHEENTTGEHAQIGLARDLYQMLNGLEQKRKEEEQKASLAEQALLEFQQLQQGVQVLKLSPDS